MAVAAVAVAVAAVVCVSERKSVCFIFVSQCLACCLLANVQASILLLFAFSSISSVLNVALPCSRVIILLKYGRSAMKGVAFLSRVAVANCQGAGILTQEEHPMLDYHAFGNPAPLVIDSNWRWQSLGSEALPRGEDLLHELRDRRCRQGV